MTDSQINNTVKWTPGYIRTNMKMWNTLDSDPRSISMPLLFKTTLVDSDARSETHLRLGYYDDDRKAFYESGDPLETSYRESVMWWYQFPMPPTEEPKI